MGSGAPLDYHRMPPGDQYYNMRQPQYHQPFTASGGSGNYYTSTAGSLPQQSPVSHTTAVLESNPPTSDQVEVDSWEQIVTETEPIGTKGSVTNEDVATIPSQPLDADIERHVLADEGPDKVPFEPSSINITTNTSTVNATLPVAATISQSSSSSSPSVDRNTLPKDPTPSKMTSSIKTVLPPPRDMNDKESVSIVFIGHVDAGKSTIGGHIMYLTGQVDKRTLEKYEREAKEKNRETWYLSWALDTNQEERDKGKTVEVGQALFETDRKRFTILDAPGHAGYVPNMIGGTVQADIGVLVISARRGEFETGFEKGGQTREHAMLAKTAGMRHLVILINKMDDPTVNWSIARFEECKTKLTPFLKKVGFNPKTDLHYIPVSGLTGANLKEKFTDPCVAWYK
jgi:signal recognition particle receptor subunit beta